MVYNGFITADERGNDMRGFKKVLGIALALALLLTVLYPVLQTVAAAEFILEPSQLQGSDYTDPEILTFIQMALSRWKCPCLWEFPCPTAHNTM